VSFEYIAQANKMLWYLSYVLARSDFYAQYLFFVFVFVIVSERKSLRALKCNAKRVLIFKFNNFKLRPWT